MLGSPSTTYGTCVDPETGGSDARTISWAGNLNESGSSAAALEIGEVCWREWFPRKVIPRIGHGVAFRATGEGFRAFRSKHSFWGASRLILFALEINSSIISDSYKNSF